MLCFLLYLSTFVVNEVVHRTINRDDKLDVREYNSYRIHFRTIMLLYLGDVNV